MFKWFGRAGWLLVGLSLNAQASYGPTAEEAKALPGYCQGSAEWNAILGPDATWNNHTCYGLNWLNRYYRARNPRDRKFALQTALSDFNYSIKVLKPDFLLVPEIYMYRGITHSLLGKNGAAMADLYKAIEMNPKLARAYAELADIYDVKLVKPSKALEIVTQGLRHNPETKPLQRRYAKLGGKLPFPAPIESASAVVPAAKTDERGMPATDRPAEGSPEPAAVAAPVAEFAAPPKIGSQKNPYCRFCPD